MTRWTRPCVPSNGPSQNGHSLTRSRLLGYLPSSPTSCCCAGSTMASQQVPASCSTPLKRHAWPARTCISRAVHDRTTLGCPMPIKMSEPSPPRRVRQSEEWQLLSGLLPHRRRIGLRGGEALVREEVLVGGLVRRLPAVAGVVGFAPFGLRNAHRLERRAEPLVVDEPRPQEVALAARA